jgi:hypothetical protein
MATLSLQRSREELQRQGYDTWIVEKPYNPWTKRREDLFNLFDLVAIRRDMVGVCGVQACGEDLQAHIEKVLEGFQDGKGHEIPPNPHLSTWLKAGNRAFIWAWRLRKHEGTKPTWQLREIEFLIHDGEVIHRENPVTV